jgi:hypothetical protein
MSQDDIKDEPEHWRRRAEETRALANKFDDPVIKETLMEIADVYEQLAERSEQRRSNKE